MIKGSLKLRPRRPQKTPITLPILKKIVDILPVVLPSRYFNTLYRSLFSLMYFACLRVGEVAVSTHDAHTLKLSSLLIKNPTSPSPEVVISLLSFKHSSSPAHLYLPNSDIPRTCPKANLISYLKLRPLGHTSLFVDRDGNPITRYALTKVLNKALVTLGLDPNAFSSHSFRSGRASDLALLGYSTQMIRQTGRWRSNAFLNYLRFPLFHLPE